jgi:hypothetical protein
VIREHQNKPSTTHYWEAPPDHDDDDDNDDDNIYCQLRNYMFLSKITLAHKHSNKYMVGLLLPAYTINTTQYNKAADLTVACAYKCNTSNVKNWSV